MKKLALVLLILFTSCAGVSSEPIVTPQPEPTVEVKEQTETAATLFDLTSNVFEYNEYIPSKYTCDGANVSPPLTIHNVPDTAQSLVLIVSDPDAQSGTWYHWVVWNIDPKTTEISENAKIPNAIQGITSYGDIRYQGPCPPSGTHHYYFMLYALDTMLDIKDNSKASAVEEAMQNHILKKAELLGLYSRV